MLKRVNKELSTRRKACPAVPILTLASDDLWYRNDSVRVATRNGDVFKVPRSYPFNPPIIETMPGLDSSPGGSLYKHKIDFWTWAVLIAPHPILSVKWPVYTHDKCLCCISPACDWAPNLRLDDMAAYTHFLRRVHSNVRYGWIAQAIFPTLLPREIVDLIMSFVVKGHVLGTSPCKQ